MKPGNLFALVALSLILSSPGIGQEPTRWRGPEANGIYPGTGLLKTWPATGPEIIWSYAELGQGHSSAVASGEFIYSTGMKEGTGSLYKFKLNGELVYTKPYGTEFTESYYGTRGTPVIVGDKVYILSAMGVLYCLNEADGSLVWKQDLVSKYGGKTITWGYNETPVVDGDKIYCTPGGEKNSVIALNRNTGSLCLVPGSENDIGRVITISHAFVFWIRG